MLLGVEMLLASVGWSFEVAIQSGTGVLFAARRSGIVVERGTGAEGWLGHMGWERRATNEQRLAMLPETVDLFS